MDPVSIDLNADLGEGFGVWRIGDDDALLDVVTSANIACGFHGGDAPTMRRTVDLAAERGVVIGAHVSYRDLAGFGRRDIDVAPDELRDEILYQLGALSAFCAAARTPLCYVKLHGALYHRTARDETQAAAAVDAIRSFDPQLVVLGAPGSALLRRSIDAGLRLATEGFADRAYRADGSLVSRRDRGAVHERRDRIVEQAVSIARDHAVSTVDGSRAHLRVDSLCVHGDTPGAVDAARDVRAALAAAGVTVRPFIPRAVPRPE